MQAKEIKEQDWLSFLDRFNRSHEGWKTTVQVEGEGHWKTVAKDMPLLGVKLDDHDGEHTLNVLLGDRPDIHITHMIDHWRQIFFEREEPGEREELTIEMGDRRTLIHCENTHREGRRGVPGEGKGRVDEVGHSGVYPLSASEGASKEATIQAPQSWGQGERGAEGYEDHGDSELPNFKDPEHQA